MLSFTKKSDDEPTGEPRWHVNFRNPEGLPDTKVVRTTFFVNTAAIALTLALLLWAGYREYHIRSLDDQIAAAEQQIQANGKQNKEALRLSQLFSTEEKKLAEAEAFLKARILPSEFIGLIGQTLPKEVSVSSVEARLTDPKSELFIIRGLVAGSRDQASGSASSYVDTLRGNRDLAAIFDPITLERLNPDGATGLLSFEISMRVKPEGKK